MENYKGSVPAVLSESVVYALIWVHFLRVQSIEVILSRGLNPFGSVKSIEGSVYLLMKSILS